MQMIWKLMEWKYIGAAHHSFKSKAKNLQQYKKNTKIKITLFLRQDAIDFVFCMLNKLGRYKRNHEIHLLFLIYSNEF